MKELWKSLQNVIGFGIYLGVFLNFSTLDGFQEVEREYGEYIQFFEYF